MATKNVPKRRVAAQVHSNISPTFHPTPKSVLMERSVHIDDLKDLKFENRSLFTILITERQWTHILQAKGKVCPNLVLQLYQELCSSSPSHKLRSNVFIRGNRVDFASDTIASFLGLPQQNNANKQPTSSKWSANEIYHTLTDTKDHHADRSMNEVISHNNLVPFFQLLHLIVATSVTPIKDTKTLTIKQGKFLLDIVHGVDIDLPNHIFKRIQHGVKMFGSSNNGLPFGVLITGLMLKAGVEIRSDEQGDQPMEPIRLTKPISKTGKLTQPSRLQAGTTSSREDRHIRPPWFEAMLIEIDSRVAAQIAPIKSQLKDIEDRLQELRHKLV